MSDRQLSPGEHELLSKHDRFLAAEFAKIRGAPENQPDENGEYTELVRSLMVAVDKTKGGNFVLSLERVCYFLARYAPEIRVPQSLDAGPAAMKLMRAKFRAYVVDESQREVRAKWWWEFWRI